MSVFGIIAVVAVCVIFLTGFWHVTRWAVTGMTPGEIAWGAVFIVVARVALDAMGWI